MNRRFRQSVVATTAGALAVAAAVLGVNAAGTAPTAKPASGEGAPGALGAHLEDLMRTSPGGTKVEEGPASAAEAA